MQSRKSEDAIVSMGKPVEGGILPSLGGIKGSCLQKAAPEKTLKQQTGSNQARKRREDNPG